MGKFVPRERKHKQRVRAEEERQAAAAKVGIKAVSDANADVILPPGKEDKEDKRKKLREEMRAAQPQSKISKKKQKRLDKYIVRFLETRRTCAVHAAMRYGCRLGMWLIYMRHTGQQAQEGGEPRHHQEARCTQGRHQPLPKLEAAQPHHEVETRHPYPSDTREASWH